MYALSRDDIKSHINIIQIRSWGFDYPSFDKFDVHPMMIIEKAIGSLKTFLGKESPSTSHDTYAYEVLLLEIGLWQTVLEHRYLQGVVKDVRDLEPEQIRGVLVKIARQSLGFTMGADY